MKRKLYLVVGVVVVFLVLLSVRLGRLVEHEQLPEAASSVPASPDATLAEREQMRDELIKSIPDAKNREIRVRGVVVDEHESPVAGAMVSYHVRRAGFRLGSLADFEDLGAVETGWDGMFVIENRKGYILGIDGMEKAGYRWAEGDDSSMVGRSLDENRVRRYVLISEDAITDGLTKNEFKIQSGWTGEPVYLDLTQGQVAEEADLAIVLHRDGSSYDFKRWSVEIWSKEIGIQEVEREAMALAPVDGYKSLWSVVHEQGEPGMPMGASVFLMLRLADGRYAKVVLEFFPPVRRPDGRAASAEVTINELGGRVFGPFRGP